MKLFLPVGEVDAIASVSWLAQGQGDPTMRTRPGEIWRATITAAGPATMHLTATSVGMAAELWGDGAELAAGGLAALLGLTDDVSGFDPGPHVRLASTIARQPGLRLPATGNLVEALVVALSGQGVSPYEGHRTYRQLVQARGEVAPGPGELMVQPTPSRLADIANYDLHVFGFEQARAHTLRRIGAQAHSLADLTELGVESTREHLSAIDGLAPGTVEHALLLTFADPDAVPSSSTHIAHIVGSVLADEPHADDARMFELLERWPGQRGRVVRVAEATHLASRTAV